MGICCVSVPYGDLFYFYRVSITTMKALCKRFRPLWGSFLFLCYETSNYEKLIRTVSVPYGDLFYFYLHSTSRTKKETMQAVSVPYGDLFYFYAVDDVTVVPVATTFPSPMGIFFISIL